MIPIDLAGRVCVITGAAGDLGRVIARAFARCGADVVVSYLTGQSRSEALCDELRTMGVRAIACRADVTWVDDVLRMRDRVDRELGPAGILVNNAAAPLELSELAEQRPVDHKARFHSCMLHYLNTAKAFVPGMARNHWGRVIGISPECAMQVVPSNESLLAGKRAMNGVLRTLAHDIVGGHITVNQVAPGWMGSEEESIDSPGPALVESPIARRAAEQEIANVVVLLASNLAASIHGAYVPVSASTAFLAGDPERGPGLLPPVVK